MKGLKRTIYIVILVVSGLTFSQAQDIHFSQFYAAPLDLNPALTGVFNCTKRFTANYRNQYSSVLGSNPYSTQAISYDQKIPVARDDYFGVGGLFMRDVAGSLDFGLFSAKISASFSKHLSSTRSATHYAVVGVNGGITQRSLDWSAARWGLQHDGMGGFDPLIDGEHVVNNGILDQEFLFADFSAGVLWFGLFNKGESSGYVGFAAHHLNRANQSIYVVDNQGNEVFNPLYTKYTFHAGGELGFNNGISLVPGIVYFNQGPDVQINGGTSIRFALGNSRFNEQSVEFGTWVRISDRVLLEGDEMNPDDARVSGVETKPWVDALILSTKFNFNEFGIGFSYDINVSNLKEASNGNGAFEFSLLYKICGPESRGVYCPKF